MAGPTPRPRPRPTARDRLDKLRETAGPKVAQATDAAGPKLEHASKVAGGLLNTLRERAVETARGFSEGLKGDEDGAPAAPPSERTVEPPPDRPRPSPRPR